MKPVESYLKFAHCKKMNKLDRTEVLEKMGKIDKRVQFLKNRHGFENP